LAETEREVFTPNPADGVNIHRILVEFDEGVGLRKLVHPEGGCQPGNCECGRNLSMSLEDWVKENYDDDERAAYAQVAAAQTDARPLGTCYDCSDITEPQVGHCWVQSWFENMSADEIVTGEVEFDVRPVYDDGLLLEVLRARVPGESTR
jgi:hypothetical protein